MFALLATVCLVFPKNGIELTLRFPSLQEVFSNDTTNVDLEKNLQDIENAFVATLDSLPEMLENERLKIEPMELGFMCGRIAEDGDESPSSEKEALHWLIRNNHSRIVSALDSVDVFDLFAAVWASMGHAVRNR